MHSNQFRLKDFEMGGTLAKKLRAWRKQGKSYRWIAGELSSSGTKISRTTVDAWCRELNISPSTPNAEKTECVHGHPFTPENTRIDASGRRNCRECGRESVRRYRKDLTKV